MITDHDRELHQRLKRYFTRKVYELDQQGMELHHNLIHQYWEENPPTDVPQDIDMYHEFTWMLMEEIWWSAFKGALSDYKIRKYRGGLIIPEPYPQRENPPEPVVIRYIDGVAILPGEYISTSNENTSLEEISTLPDAATDYEYLKIENLEKRIAEETTNEDYKE